MNYSINDKTAVAKENHKEALLLVKELNSNVNDLKRWKELSKIVTKDPDMNDDFWAELCELDFTKIQFFPIRSLLAGILKNKRDVSNISRIYDYIVLENKIYFDNYEQRIRRNTPATLIIYFGGFLGVGFFAIANFILLFFTPLNYREVLFNLIAGCFISALVAEISDRQYLFEWKIPYFENGKFLAYVWAYIPIIVLYLYMNITLLYTQGFDYSIENQFKLTIGIYIVILIIINTLFKLKNSIEFIYKSYFVIFKLISFLSLIYIITMYFVGEIYISVLFIIVTIIIGVCLSVMKKSLVDRIVRLLFYPMTFFYLTYLRLIFDNYNIVGLFNELLYAAGVLAGLIILMTKTRIKTK